MGESKKTQCEEFGKEGLNEQFIVSNDQFVNVRSARVDERHRHSSCLGTVKRIKRRPVNKKRY